MLTVRLALWTAADHRRAELEGRRDGARGHATRRDKWGVLQVDGSDDYKAQCVQIAAKHGFKLLNPELQQAVAQERALIEQERNPKAARDDSGARSTTATTRQPRVGSMEETYNGTATIYGRSYMDVLIRRGSTGWLPFACGRPAIRRSRSTDAETVRFEAEAEREPQLGQVRCRHGATGVWRAGIPRYCKGEPLSRRFDAGGRSRSWKKLAVTRSHAVEICGGGRSAGSNAILTVGNFQT